MRYSLTGMVAAGLLSVQAEAGEWSCRNNNAEIACKAAGCEITLPGGFTPMDLTVNSDGGLSLCAYSGCWEGEAAGILRIGPYLTVVGEQLAWSGTSGSPGDVVATLDTTALVANVLADGYAQPMTCEVR